MTAPVQLLAKSRPRLSLEQHLCDTELAARLLFRVGSRWHSAITRFFKLTDAEVMVFLSSLRVACLAHDIGKANHDFLRAMVAKYLQTIRHEHLSAVFLHHPRVHAWLAAAHQVIDLPSIVAAVATHHLKCARSGDLYRFGQPRSAPDVELYFDHPEIEATLVRIGDVIGSPPPPALEFERRYVKGWVEPWRNARKASAALEEEMRKEGARSLPFALKAALIACDSVASALVRQGRPIGEWIDEVAHREAIDGAAVLRDVIEPRVRSIEARTGKAFAFQSFQEGAARLPSRALLLAACGAGKTLAAWRWAQAQADERHVGRVIFLYPTRGTATEGFRDYVGWAPEADAALVHGTARYELERMAENPPESLEDKTAGLTEAEQALAALGLWSKRYFSATVDQFLSFLENHRGALCLVPALADAVVVVDEVHSYDDRMFKNLLQFLERTDVPVLAMTATLTPSRRRQIEQAGMTPYPGKEHRDDLAELERLECSCRYRHEGVSGEKAALSLAIEAAARGQRVLWVVNVVKRAQRLAAELTRRVSCDVLSYHSRFRLMDRQRAHRETVAAFQGKGSAVIAVTTQVCEMSLDLDADVLITECAPIPSLVQRFGRANRHLLREFARLFTYAPESEAPYDRSDLEAANRFLAALPRDGVSQRNLADLLETHAPAARDAPSDTARFFGGGYYATPGDFRDTEERSRQAVLDTDVEAVLECLAGHRPIDGYLVPVPAKCATRSDHDAFPAWLSVASGALYDSRLGFKDER